LGFVMSCTFQKIMPSNVSGPHLSLVAMRVDCNCLRQSGPSISVLSRSFPDRCRPCHDGGLLRSMRFARRRLTVESSPCGCDRHTSPVSKTGARLCIVACSRSGAAMGRNRV
jgi:hypothetical protein